MFRSSGVLYLPEVRSGTEIYSGRIQTFFGKRLLVNVHCFSFPSAKIQQEKAEKKSFRIAVAKPSH